jgi:hypothetical protein
MRISRSGRMVVHAMNIRVGSYCDARCGQWFRSNTSSRKSSEECKKAKTLPFWKIAGHFDTGRVVVRKPTLRTLNSFAGQASLDSGRSCASLGYLNTPWSASWTMLPSTRATRARLSDAVKKLERERGVQNP